MIEIRQNPPEQVTFSSTSHVTMFRRTDVNLPPADGQLAARVPFLAGVI
ncbi:MAG: hypothetical protein WBQ58_02590 [Methanoregula sp.]